MPITWLTTILYKKFGYIINCPSCHIQLHKVIFKYNFFLRICFTCTYFSTGDRQSLKSVLHCSGIQLSLGITSHANEKSYLNHIRTPRTLIDLNKIFWNTATYISLHRRQRARQIRAYANNRIELLQTV